jgi:hypothetical protein
MQHKAHDTGSQTGVVSGRADLSTAAEPAVLAIAEELLINHRRFVRMAGAHMRHTGIAARYRRGSFLMEPTDRSYRSILQALGRDIGANASLSRLPHAAVVIFPYVSQINSK